MIYDGGNFKILKGFTLKLVTGSGNPMVNRRNDKYVKKESFFIRSEVDKMVNSFRFNKRSLTKLFENSKKDVSRIQAYVESVGLSYKSEDDVIRILEFAFN